MILVIIALMHQHANITSTISVWKVDSVMPWTLDTMKVDDYIISYSITLYHTISYCILLCYASILYDVMSYDVMLYYVILSYITVGFRNFIVFFWAETLAH